MDNKLKAVVIIAVAVIVALPITVSLLNHGQPVAAVSQENRAVPPAINTKSPYYSQQPPTFVDDPAAVGEWKSVDFVGAKEDFTPGTPKWTGDLYLKGLTIKAGGSTTGPWHWTKGSLWHPGDHSTAKYEIRTIDGSKYMFMEWISGDVLIRGEAPRYYVLKSS